MSKLNFSVILNSYEDSSPTSNPMQNVIKWTTNVNGLTVQDPEDGIVNLQPGATSSLFNGVVSTSQDNTTEFELSLKPGTAQTYVLKHSDGTAPGFRTLRATAQDATSEITLTKVGSLVTATNTSGTVMDMDAISVGDTVFFGASFATENQGYFKALSSSSDSVSFENVNGTPEVVVLGAGFASVFKAFSQAGAQIDQEVSLSSDFGAASGTYTITAVQDDTLELYSASVLPELTVVSEVSVYSMAKKLLYVEAKDSIVLNINGVNHPIQVSPGIPGIYLSTGIVHQASVTNPGSSVVKFYWAATA